jgi:RNA polymerase sigma-70 factor (ECF subfamily)
MAMGLGREELQRLYTQLAPAVHRRARLLLGRDADAWDIVQEVFEKMLEMGDSFRNEAQPMTWAWRITTNLCLNHLRARRLREPALQLVSAEATVDLRSAETRQLLEVWLTQLDEREQQIAALLYIDGLTQEEAADVLGLSRKTIGREVEQLRAKATALGAAPGEGNG